MRIGWIGVLALLLLAFGFSPAAAQTAPSFDCAKAATVVEKAICGDPGLAQADAAMARLFAATQVSALGEGPSNVVATQREWLRERAKCSAVAGTYYTSREECLSTNYRMRNEELAVAALFVQPDLALATLRKLDPGLAPIYDALFRYASHPAGTDWSSSALAGDRTALLDLIRPLYERALAAPKPNLARDMLEEEVPSLDKALGDDLTFGHTLTLLALFNDSDKGAPMTMPCAAMIRRPGLGMTDPLFGSSYDMGIPISDCDMTLPPLPRFDLLVRQAEAARPQCDGSMRYMAYREFRSAVDGARLGPAPEPGAGTSFKMSDSQVKRYNDAILELARHYMTYFHTAPGAAKRAAVRSVAEVLDTSRKCGGED